MADAQDVLKVLVLEKFIDIIKETVQEANELGLQGCLVNDVIVSLNDDGEYDIILEWDDAPEREDV